MLQNKQIESKEWCECHKIAETVHYRCPLQTKYQAQDCWKPDRIGPGRAQTARQCSYTSVGSKSQMKQLIHPKRNPVNPIPKTASMRKEECHGTQRGSWRQASTAVLPRTMAPRRCYLCYLCYHSTFPTHPPHSRCKTKDEHTSFKIDMHCFTCEQILHLTCHTDIWQHHWCSCFRLFNIIFWKTSTEIACTCKTQTDTCIPHSNT